MESGGGSEYALACNSDLPEEMGNIWSGHSPSFADCIERCDNTASCTAATFKDQARTNSTNCLLQAVLLGRAINPTPRNGSTLAYKTASTKCAALLTQGRRVQLPERRDYTLQCKTDVMIETALRLTYTGSMNECLIACDNEEGCAAISYRESDQRCTLTSAGKADKFVSSDATDVAYLTALDINKPLEKELTGSWGHTIDFPVIPVAVALLPNSQKLLAWSADYEDDYTITYNNTEGRFTHFAEMDISTQQVTVEKVANTHHVSSPAV
jgi:hypothetical protein